MYDAKEQERERERQRQAERIHAASMVNEINAEIVMYQNAMEGIQAVQENCSMEQESWNADYQRLSGNEELSNVQKTDVFEGEMANQLKGDISKASTDVANGISQANHLYFALAGQVTSIEGKIQQLQWDAQDWARLA